METRRHLYRLLSELLEYPGPALLERARECQELLPCHLADGEAARLLAEVVSFAEATPMGRMEELYTATFDLDPRCCPYVGYQLLGEDPRRSDLMVKLQESYLAAGFSAGNELPDHIAVLLRFLAWQGDPALERELADEIVSPALAKMAQCLEEKNPYRKLMRIAFLAVAKDDGRLETIEGARGDDRGDRPRDGRCDRC